MVIVSTPHWLLRKVVSPILLLLVKGFLRFGILFVAEATGKPTRIFDFSDFALASGLLLFFLAQTITKVKRWEDKDDKQSWHDFTMVSSIAWFTISIFITVFETMEEIAVSPMTERTMSAKILWYLDWAAIASPVLVMMYSARVRAHFGLEKVQ